MLRRHMAFKLFYGGIILIVHETIRMMKYFHCGLCA